MVSDPIADTLTRIRNGYLAGSGSVAMPWSKLKQSLVELLVKKHYLESSQITEDAGKHKILNLKLRYDHKQPAVTSIKRISRPSLRVYVNKSNLPRVLGGMGIAVLSTPQGLLTDKEARGKGLGGEVICEVF